MPGLGEDVRPQVTLLLADKKGNNIERLYTSLLLIEGVTKKIAARDLLSGGYRRKLHAHLTRIKALDRLRLALDDAAELLTQTFAAANQILTLARQNSAD